MEISNIKSNPILIHGRRIEAMFAYVAASLGETVAIKQEDSGNIFAVNNQIRPPDYRIVLENGAELLVEVKNHHAKDPTSPHVFEEDYFKSIQEYAQVFRKDLKIALYWSKWNIWTLNSPNDFKLERDSRTIDLPMAMQTNEMSSLGDRMLATTPPLKMRIIPDRKKPVEVSEDEANFTIGALEFHSGDVLIEDKSERNLAFYLMLFGRWPASDPKPVIRMGNELEAMEVTAVPDFQTSGLEPFSFIGELSGMISAHYNFLTASIKGIERLAPEHEPSTLGVVIPSSLRYLRLRRYNIRKSLTH